MKPGREKRLNTYTMTLPIPVEQGLTSATGQLQEHSLESQSLPWSLHKVYSSLSLHSHMQEWVLKEYFSLRQVLCSSKHPQVQAISSHTQYMHGTGLGTHTSTQATGGEEDRDLPYSLLGCHTAV